MNSHDHTPLGFNTITVSRWQYGGPRTEEFAPGPTGQVLHTALHPNVQVLHCNALDQVYQLGGLEGTKQVEALQCTLRQAGALLLSTLVESNDQHFKSRAGAAL